MKKSFLLAVLILGTAISSFAQKTKDVITLNDGSKVEGTIIEQVIGGQTTIQTKDGKSLSFKTEDIQSIGKVVPQYNRNESRKFVKVEGTCVLYLPPTINIAAIAGYQLKPELQFGIGAGFGMNPDYGTHFPIFLHFQSDILGSKKAKTPYVGCELGFDIWANRQFELNDAFGEISAGFSYNFLKNQRWYWGLALCNYADYFGDYFGGDYEGLSVRITTLSLKVGFTF